MIQLSSEQSAIVHSPIGRAILVLASAGSGKTRVLTERARYILENTRKDGVIALTFTNKAAEEMQSRLSDLDAVEERCWIATIHSVAQRVLAQYGHTIGLPSDLHIYERDQDRKTIFLQSLREQGIDIDTYLDVTDTKMQKQREKNLQHLLDEFSSIKRDLLSEAEVKAIHADNENFWTLYQAYQDALLNSGGMDFDDILVYAHRILLEQPWCGQIYRAKYKHVCVDEAQDLNKAQYEFVRALCADEITSVMMVGDPDQMIYGFNGSSHDYLCKQFLVDFSPEQFTLKKNYRSARAVVRLANRLKPGSQIESDFALEGRSRIENFPNEVAEATWICETIDKLLQQKTDPEIEGAITLDTMVVIARNRFVFQALEEELNTRQIAFYLKKQEQQVEPGSVFGRVLDLAIRVRLNPKDWVDGRKLCGVLKIAPPQVWGADDLLKTLASSARRSDIPFAELQAKIMIAVHGLDSNKPNIPKLCSDFQESIQSLSTSAEGSEASEVERSLQELTEFGKSWKTFRRRGLGESLQAFRNAMALGQLSTEVNAAGLALSTVHTMKGLEKDIVFLMGMCEGIFPDYRAESQQELEEERNNAFVAVTRARRWINISYPKQRKMPWGALVLQQPSRFVKMMSE